VRVQAQTFPTVHFPSSCRCVTTQYAPFLGLARVFLFVSDLFIDYLLVCTPGPGPQINDYAEAHWGQIQVHVLKGNAAPVRYVLSASLERLLGRGLSKRVVGVVLSTENENTMYKCSVLVFGAPRYALTVY